MTLADSHCHLDDPQFEADRDAVLARARATGIEYLLAVGTGKGPPDLEAGIRLAEADPRVYATAGIHPHDASKATPEDFEQLGRLLRHPKVVGLGEAGLDYHYNFSPPETQREVFIRQLALAREAGKPVIVHTREAWEDTLAALDRYWDPAYGGVMHCFSGGPKEAERVVEMGFHVSFAGVVTFPKALEIQAAARVIPDDRLLVETDAPYLAPAPHRGKRNEPAFVAATVRKVAELRGQTVEHTARVTTANFLRLFGIR